VTKYFDVLSLPEQSVTTPWGVAQLNEFVGLKLIYVLWCNFNNIIACFSSMHHHFARCHTIQHITASAYLMYSTLKAASFSSLPYFFRKFCKITIRL